MVLWKWMMWSCFERTCGFDLTSKYKDVRLVPVKKIRLGQRMFCSRSGSFVAFYEFSSFSSKQNPSFKTQNNEFFKTIRKATAARTTA
jgi:hypothetical protein